MMHAADGIEWIVEAHGCVPDRLRDLAALQDVFERITADLRLRPVQPTQWHQFPTSGGITGLCLLSESHLTCHTFPEFGSACFNVFCCRAREAWNFDAQLRTLLGAQRVTVQTIARRYLPLAERAVTAEGART